jgi:hypothetical protein
MVVDRAVADGFILAVDIAVLLVAFAADAVSEVL